MRREQLMEEMLGDLDDSTLPQSNECKINHGAAKFKLGGTVSS